MHPLLKQAAFGFIEDKCPRIAAALAYYALLSLPPLLVVAITVAGHSARAINLSEDGGARRVIHREVSQSLGDEAAQQIDETIDRAAKTPRTTLGAIGAAVVFLFGAGGVVLQLQVALNEVWNVEAQSLHGRVAGFVIKRVLSFTMVLGAGFLLLASLAISTVLAALGDRLADVLPGGLADHSPLLINGVTNFLLAVLLFAVIYKWLPDERIAWRDVWTGAVATALLFIVGKELLALYFGRSDVGSAYGAAGSLVVILVWAYYSAMIFLLGAEFTHAVATSRNGPATPGSPSPR